MIERAVTFGENSSLVGILAEPTPEKRWPNAPMAVFLNSGIIHRVGASRLYVQIARQLADHGVTSLRFDYSGIGDSGSRKDSLTFKESATVETREAMTWLEKTKGGNAFALIGLCSGADMAYFVTLEDPRVTALVQLDPFAYRTPKWYLRHYAPRVLNPAVWIHSVRVRVREFRDRLESTSDGDEASSVYIPPEYRRVFPPRTEVESGLARLADRGVRFFVSITGNEAAINYPEQYEESFPGVDFADRLHVDYIPNADHTFTNVAHQEFMAARILGWYRENFGEAGSPSTEAAVTVGSTGRKGTPLTT